MLLCYRAKPFPGSVRPRSRNPTVCKSIQSRGGRLEFTSEVLHQANYTVASRISPSTLLTQCSIDRWPRIAQQALHWGGPVSIAVYVPTPKETEPAAKFKEILRTLISNLADKLQQPLTVSVLYANHAAREGSQALPGFTPMGSSQLTYKELYPINALRNLALLNSQTDLVLFCDGDFMPSSGMQEAVSSPEVARLLQPEAGPHMLVLPAFELTSAGIVDDSVQVELPWTKSELLRTSSGVQPFHCGRYPQAKPSLDYGRWASASSELLDAPYYDYFEPYGFARRDQLPLWDERFKGYGLNKVQHAYHMDALGFKFKVLPGHFLISVSHKRSQSFLDTFGTSADPQHRATVEGLYAQFKQELAAECHHKGDSDALVVETET